jgi:hypothetical protein
MLCVVAVILSNTLFLALATDVRSATGKSALDWIDILFLCLFFVEYLMRLYAIGIVFFSQPWNLCVMERVWRFCVSALIPAARRADTLILLVSIFGQLWYYGVFGFNETTGLSCFLGRMWPASCSPGRRSQG